MNLDAINFSKKLGNELFIGNENCRTLLDFWRWAYSDLIGNTERGTVAEFIVAMACKVDDSVRVSWDSYDLTLKNGIKVEVKSSAYLQTWKQKRFSMPVFNIPKTKSWDAFNNEYGSEIKRHADIYVFALLAHQDKKSLNPLDVKQWEFYVIDTETLNLKVQDSKTITLNKLIQIGAKSATYENLLEIILMTFQVEYPG
jgi:hypothetical protein